jgi:hypothetical protein
MLFGSASEFLDASGYSLSVHQVVMVVAGLLTCFQTEPLDKAKQGAPDAPLLTQIT